MNNQNIQYNMEFLLLDIFTLETSNSMCVLVQNRELFHSFFKILHIKLKETFSTELFSSLSHFFFKNYLLCRLEKFVSKRHWPLAVCVIPLHVEERVRHFVLTAVLAMLLFCDRITRGHKNT